MVKKELTPKQQRFVEEYLIDLNATQAAIRAGYSAKTANRIASENLSKPVLQVKIQEAMAERSKRTEITQNRVLEEYARLAFLDPRKFFDDGGYLKKIKDLGGDEAAALSLIEIDVTTIEKDIETTTVKIKFLDKTKSLNGLAKHLGLFRENNLQKGKDGQIPVTVTFVTPPPRTGS